MAHDDSVRNIAQLQPGDHVCFLFETDAEHQALLTAYLRSGLERKHKVVYIADIDDPPAVKAALEGTGATVSRSIDQGPIVVLSADGTFLRGGSFDPDAVVTFLARETDRALSQGYGALHVTGEMTWALRRPSDVERLAEFETKVSRFIRDSRCFALCQYDRRRFEARFLLRILHSVPYIANGTEIYANFYHVSPEELLGRNAMDAVLGVCLENLVNRKRFEHQTRDLARYPGENPNPVLRLAADGTVLYANDAGKRLLGFISAGQDPARIPQWQPLVDDALVSNAARELEAEADGRTFAVTLKPVAETGYVNAYGYDITERRDAERILRYHSNILTSLSDAVVTSDTSFRIQSWNRAAEEIYGWTEAEVVGRPVNELLQAEFSATTREEAVAELHRSGVWKGEVRQRRKDGATVDILGSTSLVRDPDGSEIGVVSVNRDISPRKRMEESLRQALADSQKRREEVEALARSSRAVLECQDFLDVAKITYDACKTVTGATGGYTALLSEDGTRNEVLFLDSGGSTCTVDPSLPMPVRGLRAEAYRTGKAVFENRFSESRWTEFLREGHVGLDNVLFVPIVTDGKPMGLIGLSNKPGGFTENDVRLSTSFGELLSIALTSTRNLKALEAGEERFRSVVQTAGDAIVVTDERGAIVFWSHGSENLFGYTADEIVGRPYDGLVPERLRDADLALRREILTGVGPRRTMAAEEVIVKTKQGREFSAERSLATWLSDGDPHLTVILRDITARKEEENRRGAEQEREKQRILNMRSDRLRSLGQMAAGIAHELNQPLLGIRGLAEHILLGFDRGWEFNQKKLQGMAELIVGQADRMAHIIQHIRVFSREAGTQETVSVNVNTIVSAAIDLLGAQLRSRGIEVAADLPPNLPAVLANPYSLEEVLINLILNARDAVEERSCQAAPGFNPRVIVRTSSDQAPDGTVVGIEVSDCGDGIPPDILDRVFDPFFTTKGPDKGTGLGLSISKSIIENLSGTIAIASTPGHGTIVTITLPARIDA